MSEILLCAGPAFIEEVRTKQKGNPDYNFLCPDDPTHRFYLWSLYLEVSSGISSPLPSEVREGWNQVLHLLTDSDPSIERSREWFMACFQYAEGMIESISEQSLECKDENRLFTLLQLSNAILLEARKHDKKIFDKTKALFLPKLANMLKKTHQVAKAAGEHSIMQNLLKLVNGWSEMQIYHKKIGEYLLMTMIGASIPEPPEYVDEILKAKKLLAQENVEPFDAMSFPPGLLPNLVQKSLQENAPYTPLDPAEVAKSNIDTIEIKEAYLNTRLNTFYAQLDDFRPDLSFSDFVNESSRHADNRYSISQSARAGYVTNDGSFKGRSRGSSAKGLGYGNASTDGGDVFESYRRMRSSSYHSSI